MTHDGPAATGNGDKPHEVPRRRLLAVRAPLPPRLSVMAGVLAFVLPLLAWCLISYVPFIWHPLVHVTDAGDVNVPGEYSYVAVDQLVELEVFEKRNLELGKAHAKLLQGERANPVAPQGAVVWQDPPPETVMPPNSTVQLVLSGEPAPVNVPDVVGLSLPYAESIIEAAGLKLGRVDRVTSGQEAEVVLSVRPPPGNGRPPGSRVELLVSTGQGGGP